MSPKKSKPDQAASRSDAKIDAKINNVLAELWKKNLPTVHERLDLLDKFARWRRRRPVGGAALIPVHRRGQQLEDFRHSADRRASGRIAGPCRIVTLPLGPDGSPSGCTAPDSTCPETTRGAPCRAHAGTGRRSYQPGRRAGPPRGPLASAEPAFRRPSRSLRREDRHGAELQYRPYLIDGCLAVTGLAIEAR